MTKYTKEYIGILIKGYRERKDISHRKVSKLINISEEDMREFEKGLGLGKLISMQTGKPTRLFYTIAGLFALDTAEILVLKTALCEVFHLAPPPPNGPRGESLFTDDNIM